MDNNKYKKNGLPRTLKSYIKLMITVTVLLAALLFGCILIISNKNKGDSGRPYRVEAERIALKIEKGEEYNLSSYKYITNVELMKDGFQKSLKTKGQRNLHFKNKTKRWYCHFRTISKLPLV